MISGMKWVKNTIIVPARNLNIKGPRLFFSLKEMFLKDTFPKITLGTRLALKCEYGMWYVCGGEEGGSRNRGSN